MWPLIVSYYTTGTVYEQWADRMMASCDRLGLQHHVVPLEVTGSWEVRTHTKARVCQAIWTEARQPILWVDADAVIHQRPERLLNATADFAVHQWEGDKHFISATVFFNQTPAAGRLLEAWVARCPTDTTVSDQEHLQAVWNTMARELHTLWLPRSYCQIFDRQRDEPPVIEQFQASRPEKQRRKAERLSA